MYNLIIVESPAKAKTIESYLGKNYVVKSSIGHIRDLTKTGPSGLGINVDDEFKASYGYITGKKKVVTELKKLALNANKVYIATDPDREGEAIGWHLADEIGLKLNSKNRIYFSEITKNAVLKGIKGVNTIDMNLVYAQEARRKIDRIMGFKLSKLMQKKLKAKSAGRVQSVALLMIVNKEDIIRKFKPYKYDKLFANYNGIMLEYIENERKISPKEIQGIFTQIKDCKTLELEAIKTVTKNMLPKPIYTTSSFQQDSINKLSISSKRSMMIAQKLYEGIKINGELTGLITYMRTDSIRMSTEFIVNVNSHIEKEFGKKYCAGYFKKSKNKNTQDAHEGIRPTNIDYKPEDIKEFLSSEQFKIYKLIYNRTVASCMSNCKVKVDTYIFKNEKNIEFKKNISTVLFEGFRKVYFEPIENEEQDIFFTRGKSYCINEYQITNHETKPPSRYTEAGLIKELEENGVGRPSTYSSIIDTLKIRNYVEIKDKNFYPTEIGETVTNELQEYFSEIINVKYTCDMEQNLDEVASGNIKEIEVLKEFYDQFSKIYNTASENMKDAQIVKSGELCPKCSSDMVYRIGRFGSFEACGNFPKCKYIKTNPADTICICQKCGGDIIEKKTKRGKIFYGCSSYPKCNFAVWNIKDLNLKG